jgi:hypothetical protein
MPEADDESLDVIVRFHDVRRLRALDRCVFSLVGQKYRPLHIYLAVQRFTPAMIEETRASLVPLLSIENSPRLSIVNWPHPEPADARSVLLNLGLGSGEGRYIAFLDYDDTLNPEAYELLVGQLRRGGAAIAFGGVSVKISDVYSEFDYTREKRLTFEGSGLCDLLRSNCCPIHSFVIDRQRIPPAYLHFDPAMTRAEDYDFLLRICAQFPSDFTLTKTIIGDYFYKTDGSNTINTEWAYTDARHAAWQVAEDFLEQRRRITLVSFEVQRQLGLEPLPDLTIRRLLDGTATGTIRHASRDVGRLDLGARRGGRALIAALDGRRIRAGLSYLRQHGSAATWRRVVELFGRHG